MFGNAPFGSRPFAATAGNASFILDGVGGVVTAVPVTLSVAASTEIQGVSSLVAAGSVTLASNSALTLGGVSSLVGIGQLSISANGTLQIGGVGCVVGVGNISFVVANARPGAFGTEVRSMGVTAVVITGSGVMPQILGQGTIGD